MSMDFFERWFGVSPDGGDGSLEILWIGVIIVALVAFVFRRRIATWLASRKAGQR
jgi:LPXTG-motif cell wall-anchored protein